MHADYADEKALLENTPALAETLLHSLERAASGIGLHTGCNLEDLPEAMDDRDGWQERVREICAGGVR